MHKPPLVLLLGSVRKGEYETILAQGYRLGIILDKSRHATLPSRDGFDFVTDHDFSRSPAHLDPVLETLGESFEVVAILNLREFYVRTHAHAAKTLGLPGLPEQAVDLVLNKTLMRQAFAVALGPACTPRFRQLSSIDEAIAFTRAVGFPVILKPNNLYGSLFVRMVHDETGLQQEFATINTSIQAHAATFGVQQTLEETVQIEEFVTGTVHSIDCLVDGVQNVYPTPVVDVLTGRDVGQHHFGHVIRKADSCLSAATQATMRRLAVDAVKSLKIRNAAAHVEFIVSASGPKLLEIAARPGGHRNRVLEMTFGISLNHQYLRMLLGHRPDVAPRYQQPFAIFTPYSEKEIVFDGVRHLQSLVGLRSYHRHEVRARDGEMIGPASKGFMSSLVVELSHPDRAVVHDDMNWLSTQGTFFEEATCES